MKNKNFMRDRAGYFLIDIQRLKSLRSLAGFTQLGLSKATGIYPYSYIRYEQGHNRMPESSINAVAAALCVRARELLCEGQDKDFTEGKVVLCTDEAERIVSYSDALTSKDRRVIVAKMEDDLCLFLNAPSLELQVELGFWEEFGSMLLFFNLYSPAAVDYMIGAMARQAEKMDKIHRKRGIKRELETSDVRIKYIRREATGKEVSLAYHVACIKVNSLKYVEDELNLYRGISDPNFRRVVKLKDNFIFPPLNGLRARIKTPEFRVAQ